MYVCVCVCACISSDIIVTWICHWFTVALLRVNPQRMLFITGQVYCEYCGEDQVTFQEWDLPVNLTTNSLCSNAYKNCLDARFAHKKYVEASEASESDDGIGTRVCPCWLCVKRHSIMHYIQYPIFNILQALVLFLNSRAHKCCSYTSLALYMFALHWTCLVFLGQENIGFTVCITDIYCQIWTLWEGSTNQLLLLLLLIILLCVNRDASKARLNMLKWHVYLIQIIVNVRQHCLFFGVLSEKKRVLLLWNFGFFFFWSRQLFICRQPVFPEYNLLEFIAAVWYRELCSRPRQFQVSFWSVVLMHCPTKQGEVTV